MDRNKVFKKFGGYYIADEMTYLMGIDILFTDYLARRMRNRIVLETCTGGGFSTISLAKYASHVVTVEINEQRIKIAQKNAEIAGIDEKVTYICGDILFDEVNNSLPKIDAAFIDPDWSVTGINHKYRFINSNTCPPSDKLLNAIFLLTTDVILIQPPFINPEEFKNLPPHECESLYLNGLHELFVLYFGELANIIGKSKYEVEKTIL